MKNILIFLIFFISIKLSFSQNFIRLTDATGTQLSNETVAEIEKIATEIKDLYAADPDNDFKIYDCGFYAFYDLMGEEIDNTIWEDMKAEAKSSSDNYLLFGRKYSNETKEFTLVIDLNIETLKCTEAENPLQFREKNEEFLAAINEYFEFIKKECSLEQMMTKTCDLFEKRITKTCCDAESFNRSVDCALGAIDELESYKNRELTNYVLSRIKCLDNGVYLLEPDDVLSKLQESNYSMRENYFYWEEGDHYRFGDIDLGLIHVIFKQNTNELHIGDQNPVSVVQRKLDSGIIIPFNAKKYDFNLFYIICEENKDLFTLLKTLNEDCEEKSKLIATLVGFNGGSYNEKIVNYLVYFDVFADCEYEELNDLERLIFLRYLTMEHPKFKYYPNLVYDLYDDIINKDDFFKELNKVENYLFAEKLFNGEYETVFKSSMVNDYTDILKKNNFSFHGDELRYFPYQETTNFLNFIRQNYKFKLDNKQSKPVTVYSRTPFYSANAWLEEIVRDIVGMFKNVDNEFANLNIMHPCLFIKINPETEDLEDFRILPAVGLIAETDNTLANKVNGTLLILDLVTFWDGIGGYSQLIRLRRFFAVAQITAPMAGRIFLETNPLGLNGDQIKILKKYFIVAELALGASTQAIDVVLTNQYKKAVKLLKDFKASGAINTIEKNQDFSALMNEIIQLRGKKGLYDYFDIFEYGNIGKWVNKANSPVSEKALLALMKMDNAVLKYIDDIDDYDLFLHFTQDIAAGGDEFANFFTGLNSIKAWEGLIKTGLRTDVNWLTTVSRWLDEGVTVIEDVLPVRFKQNGQEIARIVDDKLIPTRFQFEGTVINEVKLPSQTFGKDVVKAADGTIGFRYQFQKTKIYRAMSNAEWQAVQTNNGLSIGNGTENFVSTSKAYSEGYIGQPGYDVLVEFTVQPKTIQDLAKIGVKDQSNLITNSGFDDLVPVSSGWSSTKAFFKGEGTAVNIGLGAQSVNTFNGNITTFVRLN